MIFITDSLESIVEFHNIIQISNNVLWDWQCFVEYSPHSIWICGILSSPQNIVMDLNNIMFFPSYTTTNIRLWTCLIWLTSLHSRCMWVVVASRIEAKSTSYFNTYIGLCAQYEITILDSVVNIRVEAPITARLIDMPQI